MTHPIAAKERDRIARLIEARADRFARHGGRRTATHLRAVAGDVRAGFHEDEKHGR